MYDKDSSTFLDRCYFAVFGLALSALPFAAFATLLALFFAAFSPDLVFADEISLTSYPYIVGSKIDPTDFVPFFSASVSPQDLSTIRLRTLTQQPSNIQHYYGSATSPVSVIVGNSPVITSDLGRNNAFCFGQDFRDKPLQIKSHTYYLSFTFEPRVYSDVDSLRQVGSAVTNSYHVYVFDSPNRASYVEVSTSADGSFSYDGPIYGWCVFISFKCGSLTSSGGERRGYPFVPTPRFYFLTDEVTAQDIVSQTESLKDTTGSDSSFSDVVSSNSQSDFDTRLGAVSQVVDISGQLFTAVLDGSEGDGIPFAGYSVTLPVGGTLSVPASTVDVWSLFPGAETPVRTSLTLILVIAWIHGVYRWYESLVSPEDSE